MTEGEYHLDGEAFPKKTWKHPDYAGVDDLAPHQIPISFIAMTATEDCAAGPKMNHYFSKRMDNEFTYHCSTYHRSFMYGRPTEPVVYSLFGICQQVILALCKY